MSVKVIEKSREVSSTSIELQDLVAAGRSSASGKRRQSSRKIRNSSAAGTAVVAALIIAESHEQAAAAQKSDDDNEVRDLDWLERVTICRNHARFFTPDDSSLHAHGAVTAEGLNLDFAGGHSSHIPSFSRSFSGNFNADGAGFDRGHAFGHGGRLAMSEHDVDAHSNEEVANFRGGRPASTGGHAHGSGGEKNGGSTTTTGGDATGGSTGGHTHTDTGGTTTGTTTGSTTGTTGGHTHTTTGSTGTTSGGTSTGTTAGGTHGSTQMDPQMMAEHAAIMNLVPASAATHVAVNSGSWFDPNTWANGQVPGDGAKVLIPAGVVVDYDGESMVSLFTVRVDGELDFATDVDTFMEVDTMVVHSTGRLTIGTAGQPVDPNVHAVIQFADNGPIDVKWDPMLFSRGLVSHGSVEIVGAEKDSHIRVLTDPMKGDTTITLDSPPTGWQVGDKLVLTGTHLVSDQGAGKAQPITVATEDEELVITAINGNTITIDRPLTYDHEGARSDLKAYVANYSRNIIFDTENADNIPAFQRGHVMFAHSDDVTVKYAEFLDLGRTDKSISSFDVASLSSTQPDSNVRGRYALHLHHTGVSDPAHPTIIEGNAVWGSPGWGFVQHDANAILSDNAAYDVFGAAFVAETGNEIGTWSDNIAIKSLGINQITKGGPDVFAFDLGRTGTGFWFQGRMVGSVDNIAAGVPSGAGFTYFHRGDGDIPIDPMTSNLSDALRYHDTVRNNTPNIAIFQNNESIATETGLEVIKANPRQDSDLRSVIDNFTAWEVHKGIHLEYTGHYTIKDLDVVATKTPQTSNFYSVGIDLHNNVIDVVVNNANIDGFATGVRQAKFGVAGLKFLNTVDQWEYIYIDVNITGERVDFSNKTAGDQHLTAADLVNGRLSFLQNGIDTHITANNGIFNLDGVKTDSIGSIGASPVWDRNFIDPVELRGSIEQNGYWTTSDGRRVAMIEEYYADRATGDVIKIAQFVQIPTTYKLVAGGFTRIDPAYNGVLNQNSQAPTAQDDFAQVQQGHSVVIDLLANDSDPDGDAIKVDGIFSQRGHVVDNHDGTVTYFADPNYSGTDTFYYFVQDTNGDITKAAVTVQVDI